MNVWAELRSQLVPTAHAISLFPFSVDAAGKWQTLERGVSSTVLAR